METYNPLSIISYLSILSSFNFTYCKEYTLSTNRKKRHLRKHLLPIQDIQINFLDNNTLHLASEMQHLQGGLHAFLHWHVTRSLIFLEIGGRVVHTGSQLLPFFTSPNLMGQEDWNVLSDPVLIHVRLGKQHVESFESVHI